MFNFAVELVLSCLFQLRNIYIGGVEICSQKVSVIFLKVILTIILEICLSRPARSRMQWGQLEEVEADKIYKFSSGYYLYTWLPTNDKTPVRKLASLSFLIYHLKTVLIRLKNKFPFLLVVLSFILGPIRFLDLRPPPISFGDDN